MITRLVAGLVACLVLSGCVAQRQYRYVQAQPECFGNGADPLPGKDGERRPFRSLDCRSVLYKTAFVEFDENGDPVDDDQAAKAIALIRHEKSRLPSGKVITLVYVHGWKNNADQAMPGAKRKDVERFSTALTELGYRARQASPQATVPVVGVYIGWRGKSMMGPGAINWLSYWGRRNVANLIGKGTDRAGDVGKSPLARLLNDVIDAAAPNPSDPSRVLLVGHSFGARVLEQAIENGVTLYDPELRSAVQVRPRVDLVLYVNAANDSRLSMRRVQSLRGSPITVRHPDYDPAKCATARVAVEICAEYPLLVAITSRGDAATRRVQPFANGVRFDKDAAEWPANVTGTFLDQIPSRRTLRGTAAGSLPFLQSHAVEEMACPEDGAAVACNNDDPACAFAFRGQGECTACFRARARQADGTNEPYNQTAYWIMDIDARVIRDHGDIWNQSTVSMLGALMSPRGFFDPGTARMQIRAR